MQSNKEIGKIAQNTPLLIAKATEQFLTEIILEAIDNAKKESSQKLDIKHVLFKQPKSIGFSK